MAIGSVVGTWEHASHGASTTNVDYTSKTMAFAAPFATDMQDATVFGTGFKSFEGGLKSGTISVTYKYDDTINDIIEDLWLNSTLVTFEYSPIGGSSPNCTGSMICSSMNITAGVGELLQIEAEFQISGTIAFG